MKKNAIHDGLASVREKGSGIFREGPHMLPNASLMLAEGVLKSLKDLKKPFVTVINSYTNQIPGHAHLDKLGAVLKKSLRDSASMSGMRISAGPSATALRWGISE
ncbi:MAG: hypothetical protein ABH845_00050 [Candidatus Omnitrophota bacterium]